MAELQSSDQNMQQSFSSIKYYQVFIISIILVAITAIINITLLQYYIFYKHYIIVIKIEIFYHCANFSKQFLYVLCLSIDEEK